MHELDDRSKGRIDSFKGGGGGGRTVGVCLTCHALEPSDLLIRSAFAQPYDWRMICTGRVVSSGL